MNKKGITKFWIEIIGGVIIVVIILVIVLFAASKVSALMEDAAAKNAFDSFTQTIAKATTSGSQVISPWSLGISRDNTVYAIVYMTPTLISHIRPVVMDSASNITLDQCSWDSPCLCLLNMKYKDIGGQTCDDLPYNIISVGVPGGATCKEECISNFNKKCFSGGISEDCISCISTRLPSQLPGTSTVCPDECIYRNKIPDSEFGVPPPDCPAACIAVIGDCSETCAYEIKDRCGIGNFDGLWSCFDGCAQTSSEYSTVNAAETYLSEKFNIDAWNDNFPFGTMDNLKVLGCSDVKSLCSWRNDAGLSQPCLIHYKGKPVVWISAQGGETGFLSGAQLDNLNFEVLEMEKGLNYYYLDMIPTLATGIWSDKICASLNCKACYGCTQGCNTQTHTTGSGCNNNFEGLNCHVI